MSDKPVASPEPVQDTWFTDRALPIMAMSADIESNRVLKLHFRRPVTDDDRKAMVDALNVYQASLSARPTPPCDGRAEAVEGLSLWNGWDQSRMPWSETKHKDAVCTAVFGPTWSIEDASALISFIERTWTRALTQKDKADG